MNRPHPEVIVAVDTMVAELDDEQIGEQEASTIPPAAPATSSYAAILDAWEIVFAHVKLIDEAARAPLADGSAAVLATARQALSGLDAWKCAGWLAHVGEAIARRRSRGR